MTKPVLVISSSMEALPVAQQLGQQLETTADVMLWSPGLFQPGKTTAESLAEVADRSDFAVSILTADDLTSSLDQGSSRSLRPNVIFELGYLVGRLGVARTFIVIGDPDRITLPSDIAGVLYIPVSTANSRDLSLATAPAAAVRAGLENLNRTISGVSA
jgi:predicted nucleotide-binding protein